jgi:hypothetical protein
MHLIVVGEGQTEETFAGTVLRPHLQAFGFRVEVRGIATSQRGRGGALTKDRVIRALSYTLRESNRTYVTTLFDLYKLTPDFPGVDAAHSRADPRQKCTLIESALAADVNRVSDCRANRFLPHIQPHEFEALLFSHVEAFAVVQSEWRRYVVELQEARDAADTPEHIDQGPETHPSARLQILGDPKYKKTLHGTRIATQIGLPRIRQECRHFDAWLTKLETLQPL